MILIPILPRLLSVLLNGHLDGYTSDRTERTDSLNVATDQQVIDALANTGAIKLTGRLQPTFDVDEASVRAVLQPEQAALNPPGPGGQPDRFIAGNITFPGVLLTDPPTIVPIKILIGADGQVPGQLSQAISVDLFEWWTSGIILIAAGGNGKPSGRPGVRTLDGGHAFVVGNSDSLLIALGGHGGNPASASKPDGGHGGDAIAIGIGAGNDFYVQGGVGKTGAAGGVTGSPGTTGTFLIPMVPGGTGAVGGNGGKAIAAGGENSFALANGGDAGGGGPGGPRGPGSAPFAKIILGVTVTWGTPAPPQARWVQAARGDREAMKRLSLDHTAYLIPQAEPQGDRGRLELR